MVKPREAVFSVCFCKLKTVANIQFLAHKSKVWNYCSYFYNFFAFKVVLKILLDIC